MSFLKIINRKNKFTFGLITFSLMLFFLIAIINFIANLHEYRIDFSKNKTFTFSNQTINLLSKLDKEMKLIGFFKSGTGEKIAFMNLADTFKYYSNYIHTEFIDPDKSPTVTKQYGVKEYNTVVIEYKDKTNKTRSISEHGIISIIKKMISNKKTTICFLAGHNEKNIDDKNKNGYYKAKVALNKESYDVTKVFLVKSNKVPLKCSTLVVAGPEKKLLDKEINMIKSYIDTGGSALLMLEPQMSLNLVMLAKKYDIIVRNDIIIDKVSKLYGGDYTVPVVTAYSNNPIVKNFTLPTYFPIARSVSKIKYLSANRKSDYEVLPFLRTSSDSWGETDHSNGKIELNFNDSVDIKGPLTIATLSIKKEQPKSKIVVIGDSTFATNTHFDSSGNGDLFLNIINYLSGDSNLISTRAKDGQITPLILTRNQGLSFWIIYIGSILGISTAGIVVYFLRRRL